MFNSYNQPQKGYYNPPIRHTMLGICLIESEETIARMKEERERGKKTAYGSGFFIMKE